MIYITVKTSKIINRKLMMLLHVSSSAVLLDTHLANYEEFVKIKSMVGNSVLF